MSSNLQLTKQDRLMVLAVHPDDETLGAGGLIQQAISVGAPVRVVFATNGDNNPWPQRIIEYRIVISAADRLRWGKRRKAEAIAALSKLGLEQICAVFLDLPDQGITQLLKMNDQQPIRLIAQELINWQPTHFVAPSLDDRHPDHSALAVMSDLALMKLPSGQASPLKLVYQIHGKYQLSNANILNLTLTSQQLERKREAILCHTSQTTLCGARFLSYANKHEIFTTDAIHFERAHSKQNYLVSITEDFLKVLVSIKEPKRWLGRPNLILVSNDTSNKLCLNLEIVNGGANIYDINSGLIVGHAKIQTYSRIIEANIPASLFKDINCLYLKLEQKWGFYDLLGWHKTQLKNTKKNAVVTQARPYRNIICVIPCYDVVAYCEKVLKESSGFCDHIIAIDDGSKDGTHQILQRLADELPDKITLITFPENQGKGVALMAGFNEALNKFDFNTLITLDSDGQHPPSEIEHLSDAMKAGAKMVIGGRRFNLMPGRSRLGNTITSRLLQWLYPNAPEDTQSGLRAFKHEQVEEIVASVSGSRYETEFEILLLALSNKWLITSIPIPTIYMDKNASSKFRPLIDSYRIMRSLIRYHFLSVD